MSRIRFRGSHLMNFSMVVIAVGVVLTAMKWPLKNALFPMVGLEIAKSIFKFAMRNSLVIY